MLSLYIVHLNKRGKLVEMCLHISSSLHEHKLAILVKTHFASKFVMFEQCLTYQVAIIMCYNCQIEVLANRIPSTQTWTIVETIYDAFSPIVIACVIN
jgi:hypothetical protein